MPSLPRRSRIYPRFHDIHFQMIQKESGGEAAAFSLLLMHAEDHLMSTLSMKELVKEMLDLFKTKNI